MGWSKSSSKRKVYSNKILPQETRKISNKQPNLTPKAIRERRTKKLKVGRRKEIIKIRSETNEKEMKEKMAKINKTKSWSFEKIKKLIGLPWWRSGWESACQCRGHGFEPWSGRIPHAAEWLGPWATVAEPARLEPVLRNKRGCDGERPAHRDEEWPPLAATRESPRTETKTQHSLNK